MADIFISHVNEDAQLALRIALGLEELGYSTWCYEIDSIAGESYLRRGSDAISASRVVVCIISPGVRESPEQVEVEVVYAYEQRKRLIPVLHGMTHTELQKSPQLANIRMALGAATSVPVAVGGVSRVIPKIAEGLRTAGVEKRAEIAHDRIEHIRAEIDHENTPPPQPPERRNLNRQSSEPRPPPARPDRTRQFLVLGAASVVLAAVVWIVADRFGGTPAPPAMTEKAALAPGGTPSRPKPDGVFAVGVMDMRAFGAPEWMCDSTRTNVNTVLSKFDGLQVFAEEKIDFLRKKRDLTAIEAAEELKIKKMISGTVSLKDGIITIDAHVVDIGTSLLEHSARVTGREEQLIELQNRIALKLLEEMQVHMNPQLVRAILDERKNENLDDYKLLTETLGGVVEDDKRSEGPSRRRRWAALFSPAEARAADPGEESAVRGALEAYRAALEAEDLDKLAAIQLEMSEGQKSALARYFQNAEELRIQFSNYDILLVGEDAIATFTRSDVFKDAKTGREVRLEVRISSELTKKPDGWKIMGLKKPS